MHDAIEQTISGHDDELVSAMTAAKCNMVPFLCWGCAHEDIEIDQTLEEYKAFVDNVYSEEIKAAIAIQSWFRGAVARRSFLRRRYVGPSV